MNKDLVSVKAIGIAAVAFFLWLIVVVGSAAGWSLFNIDWDFSNPGAFGDAFGPINVMMATIAALSAIAALRNQQHEITRLKEREAAEDVIRDEQARHQQDREQSKDSYDRDAAFERTFFNLLSTFNEIVAQTDIVTQAGKINSAKDAFQSILRSYEVAAHTKSSQSDTWAYISDKYSNDLNHYFRILYHIVLFVDVSTVKDKYFYVRLVRAMLSESELNLLALNCFYGEGREKFKLLVERYSLLHNISTNARTRFKLDEKFGPGAFDRI